MARKPDCAKFVRFAASRSRISSAGSADDLSALAEALVMRFGNDFHGVPAGYDLRDLHGLSITPAASHVGVAGNYPRCSVSSSACSSLKSAHLRASEVNLSGNFRTVPSIDRSSISSF